MQRINHGPDDERCRYLFTGDERFLLRRRKGQTSIDAELGPLLDEVEVPPWIPSERLHTVWAWFSGPGVRTWLHYDNNGCHNLNAQITGRKRCVLYPPDELRRMHLFSLGGDNPAHNCSAIDVENPAPAHAADLDGASAWCAELEAGDLLYIPAWWFHTFLHLGPFNSNVNFWWKPERPRWNVVAARQALVDAAAASGLDRTAPAIASALAELDAAAQRQQ
jgi:lysine-specific demethylase 8